MPTRTDPWPAGTPCWIDLTVPRPPEAARFYERLFGWQHEDLGESLGNYLICRKDGRNAAGIGPGDDSGAPPAWTVYFASDDVDATARAIAGNGGTTLVEPMDVPGQGRMVVARDPQGVVFGVWQAAANIGIEVFNEPGGLVWESLAVPDPAAAQAFYAAVFGWSYAPIEGDYVGFSVGADPLGGIGGMGMLPPGTPPRWGAFVSVADTDAAVEVVRDAGGVLHGEAMDTPYGRMASIADPQGGTLTLAGPPPPT